MGTDQRGALTHACISGVCRPVPAASAKHLFCHLAKTLGFVPFYPPLLCLLLVSSLVLSTQIISFGFFFPSENKYMWNTLGHRKRQNWWSLRELTACSKCSTQQLSYCEWTLGRGMIGCPIQGPDSSAKGSEKPSCLWAEFRSFPRREATNFDVYLETEEQGAFCNKKVGVRATKSLGFNLSVKSGQ